MKEQEKEHARVDKRTDAHLPVTTAPTVAPDSTAGAWDALAREIDTNLPSDVRAREALATVKAEYDEAYGYLSRLFKHYAPQCEPISTLTGVCTQIDNLLVSLANPQALDAVDPVKAKGRSSQALTSTRDVSS